MTIKLTTQKIVTTIKQFKKELLDDRIYFFVYLYSLCRQISVFLIYDCNRTRTFYHLVRKQTLNHLDKLVRECKSTLNFLLH